MFISFGITHQRSLVSWMVKEFIRLPEELLLMYTFVSTVEDVNITKVKNHYEKSGDQRQFDTWVLNFIVSWGYIEIVR